MTDWNLPPKGGHMDLPDGIYLQNMNIAEIKDRVKKNDVIRTKLARGEIVSTVGRVNKGDAT